MEPALVRYRKKCIVCNPIFFPCEQLNTCSRAAREKSRAMEFLEKYTAFVGCPHDSVSLKIVDGILLCKIKYPGHDIVFFVVCCPWLVMNYLVSLIFRQFCKCSQPFYHSKRFNPANKRAPAPVSSILGPTKTQDSLI